MTSDYNKICRLCLSVNNDLISIGSILMLYEKIIQLTNVPLFDGDGLPATICSGCCKRVTEFFKFRETCQSNFYVLQKYHLLPQKTQNVLDFISTHTRFQETGLLSNQEICRETEDSNGGPVNIPQTGGEIENTLANSENAATVMNQTDYPRLDLAQDVNTTNDSSGILNCYESNTHRHDLNESINIKQELPEDDFIYIEQVESLSCTPDILQDFSTSSYSTLNDTTSDIQMVNIPAEEFDVYSTDEDDYNEMDNEPLFKKIKLPRKLRLKECRVVLQDCVKVISKTLDKENSACDIIRNEMNFSTLQTIKNECVDSSTESRKSIYHNSYIGMPDPMRINRKLLLKDLNAKHSSNRNSLPLANKFVCSLCKKTFAASHNFREHLKYHTLKRIFELTKQKNSSSKYKFSNSANNRTS